MDLERLIALITQHINGILQHKWLALSLAWLICLGGWLFVLSMPTVYQAQTRVFVDTDSLLRPLLKGLYIETDVDSDLAVMQQVMKSRPQVEKVIRETDLDVNATSSTGYESLVKSVEERIQLSSSRDNIYTIAFTDNNREVALNLVNSLLDTLIEETLGSEKLDSAQAEKALRQQIDEYEKRLVESENRLKEFKRENIGLMPGEGGSYYEALQTAAALVKETRNEVRVLESRRTALAAQIAGEEPVFGIMPTNSFGVASPAASSVDGQIRTLKTQRSELLLTYTTKHPAVAQVDRRIQELMRVRERELAEGPTLPIVQQEADPLALNPVYQNMQIQLSTAEADLASAQAKLAGRQAEVARLQDLVDTVPEVEAQLNQLNRDYGVVKGRYEDMLARWETLQTGKLVNAGTDHVKFRVIDPPFSPEAPAGPIRGPFIFAIMVAALFVGAAIAWLLSMLRPVVSTESQLRELFDLPLLGSVSKIRPDNSRIEPAHLYAGAAFSVLIVGAFMVAATSEWTAALLERLA